MSVNPDGPQPTAGIERLPPRLDTEKNTHGIDTINGSDVNSHDFEGDKPMEFQRGVERIRVITSLWGKPTLISMFIL